MILMVWVYFQIPDDLNKIIYISCSFIFDLGEEFFFLTFAPDSYLYLPFKTPTPNAIF